MGVKARFPSFVLKLCRSEGRPMTHSSLNGIAGGKVHVPLEDYEWFLGKLAQFYAQAETDGSNDVIDLCERIDTNDPFELFHFHLDIDFGDELLAPHPMELRNLVRSVVFASLPDTAPIRALRNQTRAAMKRTDANNQHLHFFGLKVNRLAALYIHSRVLAAITQRFGAIPESDWEKADGRYWNRILDNGYNGLRMLGSQKRHKEEDTPMVRDLSNVYCVVDEEQGDYRRFPPTFEDFKQTSIFALKHHVNDPTSDSPVFYEFKIWPQPDYKVLDVIGLYRLSSQSNEEQQAEVEKDLKATELHIQEYVFPNAFPFKSSAPKRKTQTELEEDAQSILKLFQDHDTRPILKKRLNSTTHSNSTNPTSHTTTLLSSSSTKDSLSVTNEFSLPKQASMKDEEQEEDTMMDDLDRFEFLRQLHSSKLTFQGGLDSVTCTAHETALMLAEHTHFFELPTAQWLLGIPSSSSSVELMYFMKPSRFWLELANELQLPLAVPESQLVSSQTILHQCAFTHIPKTYQMNLHLIPFLTFPWAKTYQIDQVYELDLTFDITPATNSTEAWLECEAKQWILIDETVTLTHFLKFQSIAPIKAMYLDSVVASMPLTALIVPKTYVSLNEFLMQLKDIGNEFQLWDGITGSVFQEESCALVLHYVFRILCCILEAFAPLQIGDIALDTIMIFPNGMVYLNCCDCNDQRRKQDHFYCKIDSDTASPLTGHLTRTLQCIHSFLRFVSILLTSKTDFSDSIRKPDTKFDELPNVLQFIQTHFFSCQTKFSYVYYLIHCLTIFGENRFFELKQCISEKGMNFDLSSIFHPQKILDFDTARTAFLKNRLGQETMKRLFTK